MIARILPLVALSAICAACSTVPDSAAEPNSATAGPAASAPASTRPFVAATMGTFDNPWAMAFLPNNRLLVTQKHGDLILFNLADSSKQTISGTPDVVSTGQGALMDIVLAPDFATSKKIYFSFSEAGEGETNGVALATAVLDESNVALRDVTVIFRATPYIEAGAHWSGRIAFSPDNKYLFFTNGERAKADPAQNPKSTLGKVLRLNLDGTPAADNPLASKGFHPAIWSYGHRNLLGIAFDADGRLWEMEMGPLGGDEVNLIRPGINYGWPEASNGVNYDRSDIPDHAPGDGFEPPKTFWNPSLAPAGMAYYNADLFPDWKNSLFLTGLSGQALVRVSLDGENATEADHWDMSARMRSVRVGPDGALWLLEDGEGARLLRLSPVE